MEEIKKIPQRCEVAKEDTWAIEDLYANDELWAEDLKALEADSDAMAAYAGQLGESGEALFAYLEKMEAAEVRADRLWRWPEDWNRCGAGRCKRACAPRRTGRGRPVPQPG